MDKFTMRIDEFRKTFLEVRVYHLLLNVILAFLLFTILCQLLGINALYALVPAVVCFFVLLAREMRVRVVDAVGKKYPTLDEKLKTAFDNRGRRNVIVDSLISDVVVDIDGLRTSRFVETPDVAKRVYAVILLTFIILTLTMIDFRGFDLGFLKDRALGGMRTVIDRGEGFNGMEWGRDFEVSNYSNENEQRRLGASSGGEQPGYNVGPIPGMGGGVGSNENPNIFGDASSANLEGQDLDFQLHPEYGGEINVDETTENVRTEPIEITEVESADMCDECAIAAEHESIVRRYFEGLLEVSK